MRNATSTAEPDKAEDLQDREPGFYYGDMPPIRDFSEGVSGFPPRLAVRVLRARRAELLAREAGSDMPTRDSEGTKTDADRLLSHRGFGTGRREGVYWVYQRVEKDRFLKVHFANGIVVDATMTYTDGYQPGEPQTREGWRGLWEFAHAYGD